MARFFLMLDGVRILTLDDLKAHFKPLDALANFRSGALRRWLAEQRLDDMLHKIDAIDKSSSDETAIRALNEVFGVADNCEKILSALDDALCHAESDEDMLNLFEGTNGQRNLARLDTLANEGNVNAQNQLALMYTKGIGVSKDQVKFFTTLPKILYQKALNYLKTPAKSCDRKQAVLCLEKAAELGHVEACHLLGSIYQRGFGDGEPDNVSAMKWFQKAAERGSTKSSFCLRKLLHLRKCIFSQACCVEHGCVDVGGWLAYCYIFGLGVEQDYTKALTFASMAAEKGCPIGVKMLGTGFDECGITKGIHEAETWTKEEAWRYKLALDAEIKQVATGEAKESSAEADALYEEACRSQNVQEALQYAEKAAELGHVDVCNQLGRLYLDGSSDVEKNSATAAKWFRLAAERGSAEGQFHLGECFYYGNGVEEDKIEAVKWFQLAAERHYAEALNKLGCCYQNGDGVEENTEKAVKCFQKAAERGSAEGQFHLGECFYYGIGVEEYRQRAVKWLQKAVDNGSVEASYLLGTCFLEGDGVEENDEKAVELFRLGAENGVADAQYMLGICYINGLGVEKSAKKAIEWLRKAGEQGDYHALGLIGIHKLTGDGTQKDLKAGFNMVRKAAEETEFATFQYYVGLCREKGWGVAPNIEKAATWYKLAADQGDEEAAKRYRICCGARGH